MKQRLKHFFIKKGIYDYIKYSTPFYLYERLFKPAVKKDYTRESKFYQSFLSRCTLIFDIGANNGHKTDVFLQWADKVICCEPDPQNFKTLQIRFRYRRNSVFLENVALDAFEGSKEMYVHQEGSAFNTLNEKFKQIAEEDQLQKWNVLIRFNEKYTVPTTTLDALISKYGQPYFIKIDVEGYELEVLKGLSVPIPFLSMECLLPHFAEELQQSLRLLQKLDENIQFNIAVQEQLLFPQFISYIQVSDFLKSFKETHFELIARMNAS